MAVQTAQRQSGSSARRAARLSVAALALWAGTAAAQSNPPITGSMGGVDARTVAPAQAAGSAQAAPAVQASAQPAQAAAPVAASQARPIPANVVRRTTPLRVGEHAADGMIGEETEALLALQASGMAAGPGLPMLGATASRAYKRYLDSFTYPIPQSFTAIVQSSSGVGNGGGGGGGGGMAPMGAGVSQ